MLLHPQLLKEKREKLFLTFYQYVLCICVSSLSSLISISSVAIVTVAMVTYFFVLAVS